MVYNNKTRHCVTNQREKKKKNRGSGVGYRSGTLAGKEVSRMQERLAESVVRSVNGGRGKRKFTVVELKDLVRSIVAN